MHRAAPAPWAVVAVNRPEHARNPIHTDEGARAAGFAGALVAGVTTYAYLVHPLIAAWDIDWIAGGEAEVRFRSPVLAGDHLDLVPSDADDGATTVEARVARHDGPLAMVRARVRREVERPDRPALASLATIEARLVGELGSTYGERAGDDLDRCSRLGVVHPAVWPALANNVVHTQLARGPWVHTRSIVTHYAPAPAGATAVVESTVVDRFDRAGERAVLDVRIRVAGALVARLEHEAIIALPGA